MDDITPRILSKRVSPHPKCSLIHKFLINRKRRHFTRLIKIWRSLLYSPFLIISYWLCRQLLVDTWRVNNTYLMSLVKEIYWLWWSGWCKVCLENKFLATFCLWIFGERYMKYVGNYSNLWQTRVYLLQCGKFSF